MKMSVANYWLSTFWFLYYLYFKIYNYHCSRKSVLFNIAE